MIPCIQILLFWIHCVISSDPFAAYYQMNGNEYQQMTYNPTGSLLAQFIIKSKFLCAAQCARLFPDCNIAVFDYSVNSQCSLYTETLTPANLITFADAVVFHFNGNYRNEGMKNT